MRQFRAVPLVVGVAVRTFAAAAVGVHTVVVVQIVGTAVVVRTVVVRTVVAAVGVHTGDVALRQVRIAACRMLDTGYGSADG